MEPRDGDIYGNWTVVGPNGQFMFHSGNKKIHWYLTNGLAHKVSSRCIQLDFEPNGPGVQDRYRRQKSVNQCVVCSAIEKLTLHHVVPYQYRQHLCRHFPNYLRDFHDCLPLCVGCHKKYERRAFQPSKKIADDFGIPLAGVINGPCSVTGLQVHVRLARALIRWSDKIPAARKAQLLQRLQDFIGKDIDIAVLAQARKEDFGYRSHGELVIERIIQEGKADKFVQLWRQDFLNVMRPQFLPRYWEVQRPVFRTREHLDSYR